ncbi:hypothetical protein PoB_003915000 [Plakobranchus ocellatus]|uniref:UspA domain-containing protein n=1 Tax=Plakobranchus ocellatus TaxID=259542 RepID=A0AAV4B0M8_9GAST|nr:hypothetical protein PoB_003915000 [Plakobranchus ocellatus]
MNPDQLIKYRKVVICLDGGKDSLETLGWYIGYVHEPNDYVTIAYCPKVALRHLSLNSMLFDYQWNVRGNLEITREILGKAKMMKQVLERTGVRGYVEIVCDFASTRALMGLIKNKKPQLVVVSAKPSTHFKKYKTSKPSLLSCFGFTFRGKCLAEDLAQKSPAPVLVYTPAVWNEWKHIGQRSCNSNMEAENEAGVNSRAVKRTCANA